MSCPSSSKSLISSHAFWDSPSSSLISSVRGGDEKRKLGTWSRHPLTARQAAAQRLLKRLLAALGPITLDIMVEYLRSPPHILLADVTLLEGIATLLPKLARRIVQTLTEIIDDLVVGRRDGYSHESVLESLNVFPLDGKSCCPLFVLLNTPTTCSYLETGITWDIKLPFHAAS